jgi:hypothetical protein
LAKTPKAKQLISDIGVSRSWLGFGTVTSQKVLAQFLTEAKEVLQSSQHEISYKDRMPR